MHDNWNHNIILWEFYGGFILHWFLIYSVGVRNGRKWPQWSLSAIIPGTHQTNRSFLFSEPLAATSVFPTARLIPLSICSVDTDDTRQPCAHSERTAVISMANASQVSFFQGSSGYSGAPNPRSDKSLLSVCAWCREESVLAFKRQLTLINEAIQLFVFLLSYIPSLR